MSIRTKLVIFFCLAGLIPALVLFTLAWKSTIKVEETMSTQFTGIAADTLDKVERNLFERYGDVQAFGYNRVVHDKEQWYKADREQNAISRVMDDYMAAYGIYSLMILVDTQGKPIAINSKDSAGKPLNTAPLFEKRYDQAKWFTNAMAGRYLTDGKSGITGTVVEDVAIDPDVAALYGDEGLAMQFAAPVKNEAGEVVGVWVNYAKWSLVEEILIGTYETMKSNGWPNSELTLLDNEGNILIDCDPKAHGGFKRDMDGVFMKLNLAQKGVEAAKLAVAGQNGSIRSLHARKNVWQTAAYAHSSGALGYPGMGWSLLVRVPETDSLASVRTAQATLLTVLGVAVPAVLGLAFFLARVFVRPIRTLCAAVREIAQGDGDLTRRVELNSKDELGVLARDLNAFITMLHDLVARISATASEVGGATKQVEEAGRTMAQAVNEQAEQTTQTSTAVEEMSASIVEVARKAADSATNASKARDGAVEGAEVVRGVVESIRGIASTVTGSSAAIDGLGKRGEQIGSIIETIEEIADQTNLLALNAAIEAARAGDHGRGFAVVADEVRKLAERTMKATQEVSQSIMGIQSDTKQAIGKMAECSEAVQRGVSLAQKAGQSLDHITRGSEEISGMVQSIAAATEEQSAASEEITRNISGMAESGRQNAEQAELVSSCADSLSRSSSALLELVGRFKTAAPGGSAHS